MAGIGAKLEQKLSKSFPPSSRIDDVFKGNDMTIITNEFGEAVTLYIGERKADGSIKGDRYARRIVRERGSNAIKKSHWDYKGKVTRDPYAGGTTGEQ